ncbi:MAG TPA: 50S ribosomal protein L18 [Nitrososphaerales archaeon]|nr:50S ribosomal protein L18 [Nitrososphaerales archaeon]
MSSYVPLMRRRREGVTDYRSRKRAITSKVTLLVVRISNKNVTSQFITPKVGGDMVVSSAHSRQLRRFGWKGSLKSTPACYLLGLLAGKKASEKGVRQAVLYNGVEPFIRGARISAFVKGITDSGVEVPVGEEAFPPDERISGKSIADYASKLASEDKSLHDRVFSALLKGNFRPEEYPKHFEEVKASIAGGEGKRA